MKTAVWMVFALGAVVGLTACDDPCRDVDCSGHGTCVVEDGKALCECDQDTVVSPDGKDCLAIAREPILYLYPPRTMPVSVRFADPDGLQLLHSYPRYGEHGWQVIARPDGTLEDPLTGLEHYALYYEAALRIPKVEGGGFVVPGDETAEFLDRALAELGLTRREANELIVFWLPRLEPNRYNLIRFANAEWDALVPLIIEPPPDTLLRVFLLYTPLAEPISVEPQELTAVIRLGFTVVEWGGARAD